MEHGISAMVASLEVLGARPTLRHGLVVFTVTPDTGALAGKPIESGVSEDEARLWPGTPPHWVHLPSAVTIPATNTQISTHPGWLGHSRDIKGWAQERNHAMSWLSHVRTVLAPAT